MTKYFTREQSSININSMWLFCSAVSFFLLILQPTLWGMFSALFFVISLFFLFARKMCVPGNLFQHMYRHPTEAITSLFLLFFLGHVFYITRPTIRYLFSIALALKLSLTLLRMIVVFFLAILSFRFLFFTIIALFSCTEQGSFDVYENFPVRQASLKRIFLLCFVTAVGTISVCSKSSFLYPLNDWVDSNCFFTVGKSMMNGIVPYRDLFEQKGPFLYFIHGIAWLVSHDTFFGVYLIEIVACTFFLYYAYRTVTLFINATWLPIIIPLCALFVYTSSAFCHGDSVEELCLPLFAYALWLEMNAIYIRRDISVVEYLLIGITSGLVFWSKFTLVGFYLGWFVIPAIHYIKNRKWRLLVRALAAISCGVICATLPFFVYFGMHHAIIDWFRVYIYDNIFVYTINDTNNNAVVGALNNLWLGFRVISYSTRIPLFSVLGIAWFVRKHTSTALPLLFTAISTFLFTYIGGRTYPYYAFPLCMYIIYGIAALLNCFVSGKHALQSFLSRKTIISGILVLSVELSLLFTPNNYLICIDKEDLPQYHFKTIISAKESPTLLNYGFLDGGFYTTCNIFPNCKAFCKLNLPLGELTLLQQEYVDKAACDFVITRNKELKSDNYSLVAVRSFFLEDFIHTYYLYQVREFTPR